MAYINIGELTEEVNDIKANVDDIKAHEVIEFQAPTVENNYTWYRKYADGWVEQGGMTEAGQATPVTVNLPVEMASGKYQIQLTPQVTDNTDYTYSTSRIATIRNNNNYTNNTTSFMYAITSTTGASTVPVVWEVKGMYA